MYSVEHKDRTMYFSCTVDMTQNVRLSYVLTMDQVQQNVLIQHVCTYYLMIVYTSDKVRASLIRI